jgi:hypothetical protein
MCSLAASRQRAQAPRGLYANQMNTTLQQHLTLPKPPWLIQAYRDYSDLTNDVWAFLHDCGAGYEARFCRGSKMQTLDALFDEFSAAWQFPYYFGYNWAAFDECLSDLNSSTDNRQ